MIKKTLCAALASLLFPCSMLAQYTIYPTPHEQVAGTGTVSLTPTVTLVSESGIDNYTVDRARQVLTEAGLTVEVSSTPSMAQSNVYLGVAGSGGAADARATALGLKRDVFALAGKYDRHLLSLSDAGNGHADIIALGETTDATFFALASLEQVFDTGTSSLTPATLYDYADQKSRGLVEGYYGYPYSVSVKKDLMRFMMRYKMNTYLYGAKSDPYHSQKWQDAYPTTITEEQEKNGWLTQDMLKDITRESHETKVNFIWAIHPGNNFVGDNNVVNNIMSKYSKMYNLGVRQFAVFVDDVSVPSSTTDMATNAKRVTDLQKAMEAKWNVAGASPADTVKPLHFVPQIYCRAFAGSQEQHDNFFRALSATPSYVTIYTTGNGVWSVPNESDLSTPATPLGRNVAWWWNYPCNDNADGQIYTMDMRSNFYDMPQVNSNANPPASLNNSMGLVSNPMQQGEVSKTPLFSVAALAWNTGAFDNSATWEASFKAVLPGNEAAQQAYRYLAPYLRYNDPEELSQLFSAYKRSKDATALLARMDEIISNCDVLIALKTSEKENESLLYTDLAPWLLKLHDMAAVTRSLLANAASEDKDDTRWASYVSDLTKVNALSTAEEYKAYALEGMGNGISVSVRPSQPSNRYFISFVDYAKSHALDNYFTLKETPTKPEFVTNAKNINGKVLGSSTVTMIINSPVTLAPGEWVGIQLPQPTKVEEIIVADTLVARHNLVMSPDGKRWTPLTEVTTVPTDYVRFVGVLNAQSSPVTLKVPNRSIRIMMPTATTKVTSATGLSGAVYGNHSVDLVYDNDYSTYACIQKDMSVGDNYTLTLSEEQPIHRVRIALNTTNGDYMQEGRVQISTNGKRWTDLNVTATESPKFTINLPQVVSWNSETKYCDFDGLGQKARYVRLLVTKLQAQPRWLRLAEIEVNGEGVYTRPRCIDGNGIEQATACDGNAATSSESVTGAGGKGSMTYYFEDYTLLDGVTLYCDPATLGNASYSLSGDLENWSEATAESNGAEQGVVRIPLTDDNRSAVALRINWTGETAPAVYEIIEQAASDDLPLVTEIHQATDQAGSAGDLKAAINNGRLTLQSLTGIRSLDVYAADGRRILSLSATGRQTVTTPALHADGQPVIARVVLTDGTAQTFKLR